MVLIDDGCTVEGYQSDITRTTVFGKPTARQTRGLGPRAQGAGRRAGRRPGPGATCESVDAAARKVITDAGFGPGYKVPGLPHRTGHGIGLDGHEWTYLVKGNQTKLEPGMCFSDEPTIAIYGEFGVRLEDCMYITEDGAKHVHQTEPRHRPAVRITPCRKTIPELTQQRIAKLQAAMKEFGLAGGRPRARTRDALPHRRPLGQERAHLRRRAARQGRPRLGAARLRGDARARVDPAPATISASGRKTRAPTSESSTA